MRTLAAMIATISACGLSLGYVIPLVSLVLEQRGASSTTIGAIAAMPALAILMGSLAMPALARLLGGPRIIGGGILLSAASILALPYFDSLAAWFALRFVNGAASGALFLIAETWVNQMAPDRTRGRIVAIYITAFAACFALGPALIPLAGTVGPTPYLVGTAIVLAAALPLGLARSNPPRLEGKAAFNPWRFAMMAPTLCAGVFLVSFYDGAIPSLLPVFGLHSGLSRDAAPLMAATFAAGNILLQFPLGWLADRADRHLVLTFCGLGGLAGAIFLPFLAGSIALWPMLVLWGGCVVGIYTLALTIMGQRYSGADLVMANAAFGMIWGLGSLAGPVISGSAMDWLEPAGLSLSLGAASLAFVAIALARHLSLRHNKVAGRDDGS